MSPSSREHSLVALRERSRLLDELLLERYEPIAIVGVGLRFPGGNDTPAGFAEFLDAGRRGTGPIPADRWDVDALATTDPAVRGKVRTAGGGFITDIDQFDARFFNISPKEAQCLDPQHRIVLETSWEALEHANIDPTSLRHGNGGVYAGVSCMDYGSEVVRLAPEELDPHLGTGIAHSAVPGRLSYFLGWRGPSIAIDTACSSSLVALHLAVEGLRRRECDIALCVGVNLVHDPRNHIIFSHANMLAPDGRCKTFDDAADGYSRSEGCGVVVVKRLSDAKRDGDRVLALVRGTAVRQDGESGGLTVPNGAAQEGVMRAAIASALLAPNDIQYVEAHGTGTSLGDPIEMSAINAVFAESHSKADPILVGSLKTNVGHMEAAAGIGGLVKCVLALGDATIYPHLNLSTPSRHIPWERYPVVVPTERRPWPDGTRRALVNSFGFAGTIAAAVLEQAPPALRSTVVGAGPMDPSAPLTDAHLFTLSAKNPRSLRRQVERYKRHLADHPGDELADICYTTNVGRAHFATRLAGVVRTRDELVRLLDEQLAEAAPGEPAGHEPRQVAMLFTGQGSQYPGMGRALYQRYPVFRRQVDECDRLFAPLVGRSVTQMLLGTAEDAEAIHQTRHTQPALFTLEYALAGLWRSWGVEPNVLMGHSIGEVAAAAVAGLFSLEDAVTLVAARALLMQSVSADGGMVAVPAPAAEVAPLLADHPDLALAAINAPQRCVVSGGRRSLAIVVATLAARSITTREMAVSHAFHSPLMDEVTDRFQEAIAGVRFREPELTLVSNLTGAVAHPDEIGTAGYWVRQIGAPVDFLGGMRTIAARGRHVFIEVGPSATLVGLGQRCVAARQHTWLTSLRPDDQDGSGIRASLSRLYLAGLPVSWASYHGDRTRPKVTLPSYAFDRRRYWLSRTGGPSTGAAVPGLGAAGTASAAGAGHPLLGTEISTPQQRRSGDREFRCVLSATQPAYLADHVVMGQVVFPAAGYIEALLALQDAVYGQTSRAITDLRIGEPLLLHAEDETEVRVRLRAGSDGGASVEIASRMHGSDQTIERCHVTAMFGADAAVLVPHAQAWPSNGPDTESSADDVYADLADVGLAYGPRFQRLTRIQVYGDDVAVAEQPGPDEATLEHLPPAILDCALQSSVAVLGTGYTYLPTRIERCQLVKKPRGDRLRSLLRVTEGKPGDDEIVLDAMLFDSDQCVFVLRGLGLRRLLTAAASGGRRLYHELRWAKRSLVQDVARRHRHVLALGSPQSARAGLAEHAARAGTRLTFADAAGDTAAALSDRPTDVCWYWRTDPAGAASPRTECERNFRALLDVLRLLDDAGFGHDQRLWLITEGAQWLPDDVAGGAGRLAASTLWGFGRTLWSEYPSFRVTLFDLPPGADPADHTQLLDEVVAAEADEFQIGYRSGVRHVRRLHPSDVATTGDGNVELAISEYGQFAGIKTMPIADTPPIGDQIQVRVHAAGLNFKDVLNTLGLLKEHAEATGQPYRPQPLGFECAGTVLAAGPHARFEVGAAVVLSHQGCLRQRVTVPSAAAVRKPPTISFAQAAGLPVAYVTAYYALHHLAGIKAGDRILIHAAAGGVGQAAIQLAKLAGAEVYATASPRKWPLLRAQGITHVMNSRTLEYSEQILAATGDGVDIILNSLNGDYIDAGMRTLRQGGRFIELGKIGIWSAERAYEARPDVGYHSFDLSEFPPEELAELNRQILETVTDLLARDALAALPTTAYEPDEIAEALAVLSRGANVGKLVVRFVAEERVGEGADERGPARAGVRPDETYLITGGLGALGQIAAAKLVDLGARHLALVSRRPVLPQTLAGLESRLGVDVRVSVYEGDVADADDVARIMAALRRDPRPLGGIIHAAGVLADAPVAALTWEQIDSVFRSKVYGTWLLHEAAETLPDLRFFVGYSSVASVLGPPSQANYAAGNAFVDMVMHWRRGQGLPGLSVSWGPWAEAGMAAGLDTRHVRSIENLGVKFLRPARGARALGQLLGGGSDRQASGAIARPGAHVLVGEFDWERYAAGRILANALYQPVTGGTAAAARRIDLSELRSQPPAERLATINKLIRGRITSLLHFDAADDIEPDAKFLELGLDSLVAVELRNSLESTFGVPLPVGMVFDHPTIERLADFLDEQLGRPDTDQGHPDTDQERPEADQGRQR